MRKGVKNLYHQYNILEMLYIYGDSHARFSFMNLDIPFYDK
jgi:hypothetical protein